ncbi:MAG: tail fiber protein [Acetobacteraceae bacterium]
MEPFIGQITLYPYSFPPNGWADCTGQLLPIRQYTALFSLLGTTYGGDGVTTFGLRICGDVQPSVPARWRVAKPTHSANWRAGRTLR